MRRAIALLAALLFAAPAFAQPVDPYGDPEPKPDKKQPDGPKDPYGDETPTTTSTATVTSKGRKLDISAVQGLLAVQSLDGWLLYDRSGQNPIAHKLVAPIGSPSRAWFYWIPENGEPTALVHQSEAASFAHLAGKRVTYAGYRDLGKQLKALLGTGPVKKGAKAKKLTIAMEYSPGGQVPSMSKVDAGTIELVKGLGVTIKSSEGLVQFTKALWGPEGRVQHYIAVHHLTELRKDALAWLARQISEGKKVTELDVQQRIVRGMQVRDIEGPPPVVAAGAHTADPYYVPTSDRSAEIKQGDLVLVSLAARTTTEDGIYAAATWVAYVGATVPERMASAFEVVALARDEAIALITDRTKRRRAVRGSDVDQAARKFIEKANLGDRFVHRTGHALDTDLQGAAADIDDYEVKDNRNLVVGSGFTIGPGVYFDGEYGVRAEVSAYLALGGLEVTTPKQEQIEALLAK
jgi:Xaa-Pro aminopeptidase